MGFTNPLTLTIDASKTITATFRQEEYKIYLPLIIRRAP